VAIGDELISGSRIDTNSARLGRALTLWGYRNLGARSVGDRIEEIVAALDEAAAGADLVLLTGGLGPTPDDRTREALAAWLGVDCEQDEAVVDWLRALFRRFGRDMADSNLAQTYVPRGLRPLLNPAGTAPALAGEGRGTLLISLPGVPGEVEAFLEGEVGEILRGRGGAAPLETARLRVTGITESKLADLLRGLPAEPARLAFLPGLEGVELALSAPSAELLARESGRLRERLGELVFSERGERLEEVVGALLVAERATVAVAESCTGGLATSRLTDVPGSSRYLLEGVIAYANDAKMRLLGVDEQTLDQDGAVSEAVVRQMALGVRERAGASFGLASTGIAGPGGGSAEKPVGTVWLAVAGQREITCRRVQLPGDRATIKARAAQALLDLLRRRLRGPRGRGRAP